MKNHGVPLSLLSAFPTGHDITLNGGALRDITKNCFIMLPVRKISIY